MTTTELKISEEPLADRVLRQVRAGKLDEARLLPSRAGGLLTGGLVSPRSFLIDARRPAETQLMRLEAGCSPVRPAFGDDDCEALDSEGQ